MENIDEESDTTDEAGVINEFEPKSSGEFAKESSKLTSRSNRGSVLSKRSTLSQASLDKLKKEVSTLRKSISSNKSFNSKTSNESREESRSSKGSTVSNGSYNGEGEDHPFPESRRSFSKSLGEGDEGKIEDYAETLRKSLLPDDEIFSATEYSKETSINSESMIDNEIEDTKNSEEDLQIESSVTPKTSEMLDFDNPSETSTPIHPMNEIGEMGKSSRDSQSTGEIKKNSYDERPLSQLSLNDSIDTSSDKSKDKNERNLETISEDEEAALETDKPSARPVEDGKKANLSKESSKKHGRNSKSAKGEVKGVQFPVTPDVSTRKFSYDPKKIRFSINPRRESIFSLIHLQISSSDANLPNKGQHQTGPNYKFDSKSVENVLRRCIEKAKKSLTGYNSRTASTVTATLAADVLKAVKDEHYDRYRYCIEVKIGENLMQGVHSDAQCLWDRKLDSYATYLLRKPAYFIFVVCYAIYKE